MVQHSRAGRWLGPLGAIGLVYLVGAVFFPVLGFEFIEFDVPGQVTNNPAIRGLTGENLGQIFTTWGNGGQTSSYYPVRTLTFAIDYQLWGGLNPTGFKLTNLLIHLANVLLVFWLIVRIFGSCPTVGRSPGLWWDMAVAAWGAGIFAVHPVVVEPVAWVSGREELLMTLGALACLHFHVTGRRLDEQGRTGKAVACYAGAALCCAAACLSNAVAAVIPLLIVAWDLLWLPRPGWRRTLGATGPLWAMSAAIVVVKRIGYGRHSALQEAAAVSAMLEKLGIPVDRPIGEFGIFTLDRLALVLNVYWLNLKALIWPADLALAHDAVKPQTGGVVLGGLALVATAAGLWMLRRQRWALFGLVWFGLALAPASQIIPHHIHRADRFLYLPLAGLALALAAAVRPLRRAIKGRPKDPLRIPQGDRPILATPESGPSPRRLSTDPRERLAIGAAVAAGLGLLFLLVVTSAPQVQTWRSNLAVWENSVAVAPNNFIAHRLLADQLVKAKQSERAERHYRMAMRKNVGNVQSMRHFARFLAMSEDREFRDYDLAVRLATEACKLSDWRDAETIRTLATVYNSYAEDLRLRGRIEQAIEHYQKACRTDAQYATPRFNLALLRLTSNDPEVRRPGEALRLAEEGCRLAERPDTNQLVILAMAYAEAGRPERALETYQKAIASAEAEGDTELAERLRARWKLYRSRTSSESPEE